MYLGVGMLGWSTGAYVHVSFDPIDILCPTIFQVQVMSFEPSTGNADNQPWMQVPQLAHKTILYFTLAL